MATAQGQRPHYDMYDLGNFALSETKEVVSSLKKGPTDQACKNSFKTGQLREKWPQLVRKGLQRATHVVICVSMKMRMKTSRAGTTEAPIIQTGKGCLSPKGLINQPRLSGDVTEKPEGTLSFCKPQEHKHSHPRPPGLAHSPSIQPQTNTS